jgi:beta-1,4-N-acetylglucosaminyltransferase
MSACPTRAAPQTSPPPWQESGLGHAVTFTDLPRAREVGQPFLSAILPTLRACVVSLTLVAAHRPALVLINGPGTCLPVAVAALLLRIAGVHDAAIVFVESVCRTRSLSLTARLLRPFIDATLVQWPQVAAR